MLFGDEEKDWKEFLCGNAQVELAELIERAKQHKCAYEKAEDVKVAQVWCALAEMSRQIKKLEESGVMVSKSPADIGETLQEAIKSRVTGRK